MSLIKTAVFPVAGLGTRFLPVTKSVPKELLPVHDRPLIEYAVDEARAAGIERFVFVNSRRKTALEDHFRASPELEAELEAKGKAAQLGAIRRTVLGDALRVVYQDAPKGLGHAVLCAREAVGNAPFAVLLPDDFIVAERPCLAQMIEAWADVGGNMVASVDVGRDQISAYGCLDVTRRSNSVLAARGMVEKPIAEDAPSTQAAIGRYILQPTIMAELAMTRPGAGGEIQLTDAIAADMTRHPLHGYAFEGQRFDCGRPNGLIDASLAMAGVRNRKLRLAA